MESASPSQRGNKLTKKLTDLLADVINLATYAVETGRLPDSINLSELYRMWERKVTNGERLSEQDIDTIQCCYEKLEAELSPVTAVSLKATDTAGASKRKDYFNTEAGNQTKRLWLMSFVIIMLMFAVNTYQYTFDMYSGDWAAKHADAFDELLVIYWLIGSITPFIYGAFGATVRMLRVTERLLRERSFDPRRLAEHRNRLVLGTLSGGVIVLIFSSGGVGETDVKLTQAALGFMAGYSVDLLFALLDRLVKAISSIDDNTQDKRSTRSVKRLSSAAGKTSPPSSFAKKETEKVACAIKELNKK